jgi:hypothetical protein
MSDEPAGQSRRRQLLADAAISAYQEWRKWCAATASAYASWADAPVADRATAWCSYEEALEGEELASTRYDQAMSRLAELETRVASTHTGPAASSETLR